MNILGKGKKYEYCISFDTKEWGNLWISRCDYEASNWEDGASRIDKSGKYVGTLTEGDLLWKLKNTPELTFRNTECVKVSDIPRKIKHKSVSINADVESIINLATTQNFVPVVDDEGIFIGIIKRSDIINYCYNLIRKSSKLN